ncbi:hypothetical protein B0T19DRAFT_430380 [Cercophora scortea]|uniref:Uncharacterized protein n=1 Tax=Cercophora scortea TaxID=314031 RepID=A0AAE0IAL2_9PEZI|nr:hypothetical protein B0T19DRAFT_430380 [Cercophora scortea]
MVVVLLVVVCWGTGNINGMKPADVWFELVIVFHASIFGLPEVMLGWLEMPRVEIIRQIFDISSLKCLIINSG